MIVGDRLDCVRCVKQRNCHGEILGNGQGYFDATSRALRMGTPYLLLRRLRN